jgi:hypothetical protein
MLLFALMNPESHINYCNWFQNNLNNDRLLDLSFFSDEAWCHVSGYVNSQNVRYWSSENPHVFVEAPLHPMKVGVWIAVSRRNLLVLYFSIKLLMLKDTGN